MSTLEESLAFQIRALRLPAPMREYRFHSSRKWRSDFAWPELGLLVEVEGGTRTGGRHTRGDGFEKDAEKYNEAALDGWTVLRFTSHMIKSGKAIQIIERAMTRLVDDNRTIPGATNNGRPIYYPG